MIWNVHVRASGDFREGEMCALTAAADLLLEARRPADTRRLARRERRVEAIAAAAFIPVAGALPLLIGPSRSFSVGQMLALTAAYALLTRVLFVLGTGFTMPTQLALVPMVMLLPPALVPGLVAVASLLSRAPDLLGRRLPAERLLTAVGDSWYVVAPAVLLALVAPDGALHGTGWPVWMAALGLQLAGDLAISTVREGLGDAVAPRLLVGVLAQIGLVDFVLSPVGLVAAFASQSRPYAFLLTLPLTGALSLYARERAARIERALALVDDRDRQRARVLAAQRRIGETAAANLDRAALERIIVATAVDLVGADGGRLTALERSGEPVLARGRAQFGPVLEDVLTAVESSLGRRGGVVEASAGAAGALGFSVSGVEISPHILAVARFEKAFTEEERELLRTLAEQAAVCLQNLALHERVQRLAATDELTGLLNHRRLQESLLAEVRRAERYGTSLALIMLDVDDFKRVNDVYGHQQGDAVLRSVADIVRASVREVDLPARYGGEELAILLPHMDLDGTLAVAERIRGAVAGSPIPLPDGSMLAVTVSMGVAILDSDSPSRHGLVAEADAALYRAKRAGKNRVELSRALTA